MDKVILVGTGSTKSPSSADLGTTVPAGEVQSWAHQYLLDNGYSEADFTAANYIINHESGWSPTATNPTSGAYGLVRPTPVARWLPPVRTGRPTTRPSSSGSSAIASSATAASSQRTTTGSLITITDCDYSLWAKSLCRLIPGRGSLVMWLFAFWCVWRVVRGGFDGLSEASGVEAGFW